MLDVHCACHPGITPQFINQIPIYFRTKSKPLNVDAGSPLRLPSWYYAGIGKHGIPRSSTFPDTIQTNQGKKTFLQISKPL